MQLSSIGDEIFTIELLEVIKLCFRYPATLTTCNFKNQGEGEILVPCPLCMRHECRAYVFLAPPVSPGGPSLCGLAIPVDGVNREEIIDN